MSKIKWGAIVVDGRGKLGGHVFTKTRSGATMRTKVTPVNPQSSAQASARSRLGGNSMAWSSLTEAQRESWNSLASETGKTNVFGDQYFPTGKNLFTSVNNNLLMIGKTALQTAIKPEALPFITDMTVAVSKTASTITLNISFEGNASKSTLVVEASAPFSAGKYNFDGSYRQIMFEPDGAIPTASDVYTAYVAKFGAPPTGKKIGFRCYFIEQDTGASTPRFASASIVV